jgi:hypothetical protein
MKTILIFVSTALLVGCSHRSAPPTNAADSTPASAESHSVDRSTIKVGSFTISTVMDVPMSSSVQEAAAILSFGGHRIVANFDKHQLTIDEDTTISLAADVNEINVKFARGTLLVTVDEVLVFPPNK